MRFFASKKRGVTQPFSFSKTKMAGFTLLEVMVAVAIISILSAIVYAGLGEARKKARDAQRMSDLQQLQLALRQYKDAHGTYPDYPTGTKISMMYEDNDPDPAKGGELKPFFPGPLADPLETTNPNIQTDVDETYGYAYNSAITCDGVPRAVLVALAMEQSQNVKQESGCFIEQIVSIATGDDAGFGYGPSSDHRYVIILR